MQHITSITSSPNQRMTLVLDNNETVDFRLYFLPRQEAWFFDFTYNDLTVNCSKVVLTPNALRQFRKTIPFGIAFVTDGFVDPFQLTDFSNGRINMYVLNKEEVQQVESEIFNA